MLSSLAEKGIIRAGDGVMILYHYTIYHFHPITIFEVQNEPRSDNVYSRDSLLI